MLNYHLVSILWQAEYNDCGNFKMIEGWNNKVNNNQKLALIGRNFTPLVHEGVFLFAI